MDKGISDSTLNAAWIRFNAQGVDTPGFFVMMDASIQRTIWIRHFENEARKIWTGSTGLGPLI